MLDLDNSNKFFNLRKRYKYFIYENFSITKNEDYLKLEFDFNIQNEIFFKPNIIIPKKKIYKKFFDAYDESDELLNNIVFNIGLIELISYWKSSCAEQIIIKPYKLSQAQILWWKKIYFNGLGEFFYLNNISTNFNDFVEIKSISEKETGISNVNLNNSFIIPVGGGKDSVVSLELLSGIKNNIPLIINPRQASLACVNKAGFDNENFIEIKRNLDPEILRLNSKGFLNGHTPFSALVAFVSVLSAYISGIKNIALSNESSANEPTVPDSEINHQYSKSFEFESDFRNYIEKYISPDFNYFSFLRPLSELQIAKLFAGFPKYFDVFKSCNVGSKTDVWCCNCPKCLFTFIILSPFLSKEKLVEIFKINLLAKKSLLFIFRQLIGVEKLKPFECIGTVQEVNLALCMTIKNIEDENLPYLLKYFKESENYNKYKNFNPDDVLENFNTENFLLPQLTKIIKRKF